MDSAARGIWSWRDLSLFFMAFRHRRVSIVQMVRSLTVSNTAMQQVLRPSRFPAKSDLRSRAYREGLFFSSSVLCVSESRIKKSPIPQTAGVDRFLAR